MSNFDPTSTHPDYAGQALIMPSLIDGPALMLTVR
jgi:hypothetical protein